jgi:glycerol-3-phosphate dehydrogenase (NAD(P)+)
VRAVVIGAGSWGTAFARLLADHGHEVTLAGRDPAQLETMRETGRNPRFPKARLDGIDVALAAEAPFSGADLAVIAVPSRAFAEVVTGLPGTSPLLSLTKGLDPGSGERLSTLVRGRPVACLSGPNIADELAAGLPSATVIASVDEELAIWLQEQINSPTFRVYVNADIVGVEFCGAAKNVIALAAGGVDGLRLGDNAKASLITRGVSEMARLGQAAGARVETFAGLAGMGDLMVTCWSRLGRNRRAGELIAQGATPEEAMAEIGHVVEGLTVAPLLRDLARRLETEMPITDGVCAVLEGASLEQLAASIMVRLPKAE